MQLTERQCWDTLRKMVSNKNNEYRLFLHACFGSNQVDTCNHYTSFLRDTFLAKMGLNIRQLKNIAISRGLNISDSWDWIDSLSSEDLLLYYDFQCRALQGLYNKAFSTYFVTKTNPYIINEIQMYGNDIAEIIGNTNPSPYATHKSKNGGGLVHESMFVTGKPDKVEGEQHIDFEDRDIQLQALAQTMGRIHYVYATNHNYKIEDQHIHERFLTSNNCGGEILGVNVRQAQLPDDPTMNIHMMKHTKRNQRAVVQVASSANDQNCGSGRKRESCLVGFDKDGIPIIKIGDGYFNGLGNSVDESAVEHTL